MTKDILLSIRGLQITEDTQKDTVEVISPGEYYFRNGKHFFLYEEAEEGKQEITKNIIKVTDDYMEVTKKGAVNVHMVFEKNKKNVTYYNTPFGSLLIGIDAYRVDVTQTPEEIEAYVEYALEVNNEHLANCRIRIKANSRAERAFHLM
ncbi:MAG: DUF1934 domain-containing protein [Agathobacter sp.]